ncbi:MAG: hypothetical protein MUE81_01340 [Thermoflexibacter sp.]|nr:hypothetical protein [Thermoflexibacter sp.]
MKKILYILLFFSFQYLYAAKIGIITQQLNLSTEQSKQFWVVYNKYTEEMENLRKQQREIQRGFNTKTDEQLRKDIDKMMELKEKELATEKKYQQEFLKVINIRQLASLYRAEKMFKAMLLQRLSKRDGKGRKEEEFLEGIDD